MARRARFIIAGNMYFFTTKAKGATFFLPVPYCPVFIIPCNFPAFCKAMRASTRAFAIEFHRTDNAEGETHASDSLL